MNRAKSIFISLYPFVGMAVAAYAVWQLAETGETLAWGGPLLAVVPVLVFVSRVMLLKDIARTSANFPLLNALAVAGAATSVYAVVATGAPPLAAALAATGAVTFALYSLWFSRLGRQPSTALRVGAPFPDVTLVTADGDDFHTAALRGRPALIFFYRGNWCPLCMAQVKEVASKYRDIDRTGAAVLLVSPQPQRNTRALAERLDVPFRFMIDPGNAAARALDIAMKDGLPAGMELLGYERDTVFPTVVVLDAEGIVRWLDQTDNYRVRPEPDTFLPLLRELAPSA